jgi:hypothetical protein
VGSLSLPLKTLYPGYLGYNVQDCLGRSDVLETPPSKGAFSRGDLASRTNLPEGNLWL